MNLLRLIRTLKFLKIQQIFYQLLKRIYRPGLKKSNNSPDLRIKKNKFVISNFKKASLDKDHIFNFYGETGSLDSVTWEGKGKDLLWQYNLQYFDYLNTPNSDEKINIYLNLIDDWIKKK